MELLIVIADVAAFAGLAIEADNLRFFPRLRPSQSNGDANVDVCIAMRDESATAIHCVNSYLRESSVRSIVVVDDASTDDTYDTLARMTARQPRLTVLRALGSGKSAALAQAAGRSDAPYLFFTDADVVAKPGSISALVEYVRETSADAASVWPRTTVKTMWDLLLSPVVTLFLLQMLPMRASRGDSPMFAAANGQALLIRRSAYEAAGGHGELQTVVEDVELARNVQRRGYRVRLGSGAELFDVAGYGSLSKWCSGLGRSLYYGAGSGGALVVFAWQLSAFVVPWWGALCGSRIAWAGIAAGIAARALLAARMRQSRLAILFTPFCGILVAAVALASAVIGRFGGFSWRGRRLTHSFGK